MEQLVYHWRRLGDDYAMSIILPGNQALTRYVIRPTVRGASRFMLTVNGTPVHEKFTTVGAAKAHAEQLAVGAKRGHGLTEVPTRETAPSNADIEAIELREIADEVHAATCFIMEHGKIEIGTPQSKRLIQTVRRLKALTKTDPKIPTDYNI